jgi:hypothetical protein
MKLFITLLILISLFAVNTANTHAQVKPGSTHVFAMQSKDLRAQALENVLTKQGSPLAPYASYYVQSADRNEIDWRLLPAIAGLESSFGLRQMPGSHNSYGWGGGHIYFDSVEDGIDTINTAFKTKYAARGATTVEQIGPIYAESPTWVPRVRSFMNKFEAEYARLGMHSLELTI